MMTEGIGRKPNFTRALLLVVAGFMAALVPSLSGQGTSGRSGAATLGATTDDKLPEFDVVSVKPNKSDDGRMSIMFKPDGYSVRNVSLKMLIYQAYGIREDLISGVPNWGGSSRYDIDAKVAGADVAALEKLSSDQRKLMLQPLLAERFKLKVHTESKVLPIYELVVAKSGPKLKESTPGDSHDSGIKGPNGPGRGGMIRMGHGQVSGQGIPVASLANLLSQQLQQTVIDKTELTGKYDFTLQWTPDEGSGPMFKGTEAGPQRTDSAPPDATGPSVFTAIQEQLGLKLQSAKGPVETLVIDHVEMPSEN